MFFFLSFMDTGICEILLENGQKMTCYGYGMYPPSLGPKHETETLYGYTLTLFFLTFSRWVAVWRWLGGDNEIPHTTIPPCREPSRSLPPCRCRERWVTVAQYDTLLTLFKKYLLLAFWKIYDTVALQYPGTVDGKKSVEQKQKHFFRAQAERTRGSPHI